MIAIRACAPAEAEDVLAVWAEARSAAASTPDTIEGIELLLARDPGALLVAERDARIVGTLIAAFDGWRGSMYRLAVAPTDRREGIAARLVAAGEARLRSLGARRISVLRGEGDEVAAALWEAVGYGHDRAVARHVRNL